MEIHVPAVEVKETGSIIEIKQGIVKIEGLPSCMYGELLHFPQHIKGMVIGFNREEIFSTVLSDGRNLSVGDQVYSSGQLIKVAVGDELLGRVVNCLAEPVDGKEELPDSQDVPVFKEAVGIMEREMINEPLMTGIKMIDLNIPIGKGQRELIIGDRQSGKTSLCLDSMINQQGKDVICIYCWIGGPQANLNKHIQILKQNGAWPYTIVVAAPADTSGAEQYLAPYTACAIGEYFMERGRDVLVVFDDLTKHAWIYREMSLLLERFPGREAYPGDIFYLHSQLMERAGRLKENFGGGSMTFLPIVETLQGDITGYIQTNLISMTDGQIYININLFKEGVKPAVDLGTSVSRIGSKVQYPAIQELSRGLRLEYTQYREMLRFTKLRTRLSLEAADKIRRGEILKSMFLQPNHRPVSLPEEIVLFYAFRRKILEVLPTESLTAFLTEFFGHLSRQKPEIVQALGQQKTLTANIKKDLDNSFVAFFRELEERQ